MDFITVQVKDSLKDKVDKTNYNKVQSMVQGMNLILVSYHMSKGNKDVRAEKDLMELFDVKKLTEALEEKSIQKIAEVSLEGSDFEDSPLPKQTMILLGSMIARQFIEFTPSIDYDTSEKILDNL